MAASMPDVWDAILPDLLMRLKVDIGLSASVYDIRLSQYLANAYKQISREGITLDMTDAEDEELVVIYARWLWRKRDSGEGIPRMIRYALNNRLFSEKMRGGNDG